MVKELGTVPGSVSDGYNLRGGFEPACLCLESRHNSALLCLSEEWDETALGSPANRRSSVENTAELGQEYMCACLLPQQLPLCA